MIVTALALMVVGVAMMFIGLLMRKRRLKFGASLGFKSEETTVSPAIWKESHVQGGWTIMTAGLGAEVGGIVLMLIPGATITVQTAVIICTLAWVVMMYVAASSRVKETARRLQTVH